MKDLRYSLSLWTERIPDNLLAKSDRKSPDRLLKSHIRHVLGHALVLLERNNAVIERLAEEVSITPERIWQAALLVAATHDLGKATRRFQDVLAERHEGWHYFHHALASFYFTNMVASCFPPLFVFDEGVSVEGLAVVSHHHKLTEGLFGISGDGRDHTRDEPDWTPDKTVLVTLVMHLAEALGASPTEHVNLEDFAECPHIHTAGGLREWFKDTEFVGTAIPANVQDLFVFLKGLLQSADWFASAGVTELPVSVIAQPLLMEAGLALFPHQKKAGETYGHVFARLPTGTGKTELALNWAVNQGKPRLAFLLPTTSTTNQTYFRMRRRLGLFETGVAGLLHGSVRLQSEVLSRGQVDPGQGFNLPYTVATIDQALLALLNHGFWELKKFNLAESAIVIDEIHSYTGYTLALVTKLVEHLGHAGCAVCLMSATFPRAYDELFAELLPGASRICLGHSVPARCRYMGFVDSEKDMWDKIEGYTSNGRRVLLVANTVASACALFDKAKKLGIDAVLLHSQFTLHDRLEKEKRLARGVYPVLLISTQVVEVGVDIDFDVLFSEACPLTALIQRMGRVNRTGTKGLADVWLFNASAASCYIYREQDIEFTAECLREHQGAPLDSSLMDELVDSSVGELRSPEFEEGLKLVDRIRRNKGIAHVADEADALTRNNDYLKVDVLPHVLYEDAYRLGTVLERTQFLVRIPLWWLSSGEVKTCEEASRELGLHVVKVGYASERGADRFGTDSATFW